MPLPYKEVTRFEYNGETYDTEEQVIRAATEQVVGNRGVAGEVLGMACRLSPLLARACELGVGCAPEAPDT